MVEDPFAITCILLAAAFIGYIWDEKRVIVHVPGIVLMIFLPAVLVNLGLIPRASPVYDAIFLYGLPMSISLLLVGVNLRLVIKACRPLALNFVLVTMCFVIAVYVAGAFIDLGPQEHVIVPIMAGSYIGGVTNLIGVAGIVQLDPSITATMLAVDNGTAAVYTLLLAPLAASVRLRAGFAPPRAERYPPPDMAEEDIDPLTTPTVAFAVVLAALITLAGIQLAAKLGVGSYALLFVTALTLMIATILPNTAKIGRAAMDPGWLMMCLFLAAIGPSVQLDVIFASALAFLGFCATVLALQLMLLLLMSKIMRQPLSESLTNSITLAIGWPIGAAFARSYNWAWLAVPTLLLGAIGESTGSFIALGLMQLSHAL